MRVVPDSDSMIRGCHARVGAIGSCREGALASTGLGPGHKVCGDAEKSVGYVESNIDGHHKPVIARLKG